MNKFKWSSVGLSVLLILALLVWMASGEIKQTETKAPELSAQQNTELSRVEVTTLNARNYQPELLVQGQVLRWRSVMVSARVSATVKSLVVELGDTVSQGQTLLTLTDDGRSAERSRWQARVRKLNADLNAAQSLRRRNLASESDLPGLESELAEAKAELEMANQAIADLAPQAPFDGVVNQKSIEAGDLVQIYFQQRQIASHPRSHQFGTTTEARHMPTRHRKQQQWTPGRLKNWAQDIGPDTLIWISDRLDEREHPEQACRVCLGLLNLNKAYPGPRLNTSCRIANREGLSRLKHIKTILQSNSDKLPEQQPLQTELSPHHETSVARELPLVLRTPP